jgi:hypothetical protein
MVDLVNRIDAMRRSAQEQGGTMLPAISAQLPAYLAPPNNGGQGRGPAPADAGFGPAARVALNVENALAAQSATPGTGLYGPNGQFVETAARRPAPAHGNDHDQPQPAPASRKPAPPTADRKTDPDKEAVEDSGTGRRVGDQPRVPLVPAARPDARGRTLSLGEINAVVPPAAKAELRELARRLDRDQDDGQARSAREYRRIAELMDRLGRYEEAQQARRRAASLEDGGATVESPAQPPGTESASTG